MPKPPPTSGVITRTFSGGRPRLAAIVSRNAQGPCVQVWTVTLPSAGIPLGDRGARLHRVADEPVVDQLELGDVRRLGEGRVDRAVVAVVPVIGDVARALVMHRRSPWRDSAPAVSATLSIGA